MPLSLPAFSLSHRHLEKTKVIHTTTVIMPPTIHLVRHAEGYHNVAKNGDDIHDPFLTDEGIQQAQHLCDTFPHHDEIDLLVASPMKRTIQTCQKAFAPAVGRGHKILLMPLASETSDQPMDTGSTLEEIEKAFAGEDLLDARRLEIFPYWHRNVGKFGVEHDALIERARLLRTTLKARPESNIAIVSHGSFAHYITGNVDESGNDTTRMWDNTECRSYKFAEEDEQDARLVELQESIERRPDLEKQSSGYILSTKNVRKDSTGQIIISGGGSAEGSGS